MERVRERHRERERLRKRASKPETVRHVGQGKRRAGRHRQKGILGKGPQVVGLSPCGSWAEG